MTYQVKTAVFEGPLDLLLQLITARQVEITELSLTDLVAEYVGYLDAMRELDLEITSEFLLIAATLIHLKARRLLPGDEPLDLDEELLLSEERDRLLSRLLACLTFKDVAAVLGHRLAAQDRYLPRRAGLDEGVDAPPPELRIAVGGDGLALIATRTLTRRTEPDLDHLELDLPSVADAIADLRRRVGDGAATTFDDVTRHCQRDVEVVAYFLALLELARWGVVAVSQEHRDAPIAVARRDGSQADAFISEWAP